MASNKRARNVIDLTGEEDDGLEQRQAKSQRYAYPAQATADPALALNNSDASRLNARPPPRSSWIVDPPSTQSSHVSSSVVEPDAPDMTQEEDGPERELYCTFSGKVVGVRYYTGYASPGEAVLCRREPSNPYDTNAIRIDNVMYQQIGHLPRKVAEKITPYLDRGDITLEATLTGEKAFFDCPIKLSFWGPSDPAQRGPIEESLKRDKLAKPKELKQTRTDAEDRRRTMGLMNGSSTHGLGSGAEDVIGEPEKSLQELLKSSQAVEFRNGGDAIKTMAMGEKELSNMAKATQPHQLKSTLLPYQLQALAWMEGKENPKLPEAGSTQLVQLWRRHKNGKYWNVASDYFTSTPPTFLSGGILADDMGLGKTLEMISLILTGGSGPTLIVAPVSVMSNWEQQIRNHVLPDYQPKVLIYHNQKRSVEELLKFDVVITSYGKLAVDKQLSCDGPEWRRLVLDEGHTIRNAKTKVAQFACQVKAQSRWVLTGTPIINSVKDLHSLVKFLRITGGIEQSEIFNSVITRRLGPGDRKGEATLQALMQDLCLRRNKSMKFVDLKLPEKKEFVHRISFQSEEKRKYDALLSEAKGALEEYQARAGSQSKGRFSNVLERLLRLRQVCNHWTLCKDRVDELMKLFEDEEVVELNDKNIGLLQEALKLYIEQQEECAICYDTLSLPVITHCKHVFCRGCITKAIQIQHKCPMCRNHLEEECLLEPLPEAGSEDPDLDTETQSSKTEAIMQIVKATIQKHGSKIIIFSQWTSFLNIIQNQLHEANVKFSRVDGSMTATKRDKAIEALDSDEDTRVMLASLAVCSVGLNLVAADTVILSDSWWAPAIEDQAVDRVHRLGQTRETTIWRMVMEGTVEERVLDIQLEKRKLVSKAFQDKGGKKKAQDTRVADIQRLLA